MKLEQCLRTFMKIKIGRISISEKNLSGTTRIYSQFYAFFIELEFKIVNKNLTIYTKIGLIYAILVIITTKVYYMIDIFIVIFYSLFLMDYLINDHFFFLIFIGNM